MDLPLGRPLVTQLGILSETAEGVLSMNANCEMGGAVFVCPCPPGRVTLRQSLQVAPKLTGASGGGGVKLLV